jgi:hypothetical protein
LAHTPSSHFPMAQLDRAPVAQFKFPRFRFTWSPKRIPEAKWRLSLLGLYHREVPKRWHIVLSVRGILIWSTAAVAAAFFIGTATLAYVWSRTPHNKVTYADLVLPTRWSELRTKRGEGLIAEGIAELKAGRGSSAIMLLSHGVRLAPADHQARLTLAGVYIRIGHVQRGLHLLQRGLNHIPVPPKEYRELLFGTATHLEDYELILSLCDHLEKAVSRDDVSTQRWLITQRAVALEQLKRYDELAALHRQHEAAPIFSLQTAWARAQAAQGSLQEALKEIQRDPSRFGLAEERYPLEISLYQSIDDHEGALRAVKAWQREMPIAPLPQLEEIIVLQRAGKHAEAERALVQYLFAYGAQSNAVLIAFKKLSELDNARLLRIARRETQTNKASRVDLSVLYVQGLINAGEIAEADREFQETRRAIVYGKVPDHGWTTGTQALLQLLQVDSPSNRSQLLSYATSSQISPSGYRFILRALTEAKLYGVAHEVATAATKRFPAFRYDTEALNVAAQQAAPAFQPIAKQNETLPLAAARGELNVLRRELAAQNWEAAHSHLRKLERADHKELTAALRLCRIELHGYAREQSEMTSTLQLYFMDLEVDQTALRRLAEAWNTPEYVDSAFTLCRVVANRYPQAKWAHDLRKKIEGAREDAVDSDKKV